ncbi:hypothetical protein ACRALDRAFT_1052131 [Sodiomyces alcalophilus JCM 7366]|uniref:uncharacterized protein n=1 Tax=Sodiomyces alcalophilus JCM 7366 TaxID=591952 RepID=UPI0039B40854
MSAAAGRTRRTRRQAIIESSDEDELANATTMTQEEDEYTPAPTRTIRRQTRSRLSTSSVASSSTPAPTSAPRPRGRPKKSLLPASLEPCEISEADQTVMTVDMDIDEPENEPKPVPRKRKSVAQRAVKSEPSDVEDRSLLTPKASATPEPSQNHGAPLADITNASVNEQTVVAADDTQATIKPIRPMDTILERPMDIMLKSRNLTVPVVQDTTPKPRLVITHLILTNFKSYAGRQEVGPFHASFSSVVGPNGSGKSNVIDSLLFVFGFRASKMRQGKLSALIHNSAQYPNLDYCEVAVHFKEVLDQTNGAGPVDIPDSQLIISRKAFKNNSSQYFINSKLSNFTTVTTLLRDRGIDLDHKRFLILQGEVESIAQMKAKAANEHDDGLLEYLEDIIGTSKYKTPIEEAATEADETVVECTREIESRARELASLEVRIQEEEEELATIRESLKGKTQKFSDQIAAKQKSLEPWMEKINQKQSAIAVAESEMAILREKANAGEVAVAELEAKISSIEEGRAAKLQELRECAIEKARLEKEAGKIEAKLQELARDEPRVRAKVSNARQRADEARSSLAQTQTQNKVLAALMRMKESGRIDGFHGRLGNLAVIDQKYDVAISTACPSLENFVTDTVEAGQQCIEYLRKTNLGRGNFICLDKLRVRDLQPIQTPENAPRLFDLIRARDDRFRPAFYHALQDTLVANDLAQANRIAYGAKRWRVVTLDGELIDKSGTMSGGGTTVKRGLMSSKLIPERSKEQVAELEADLEALEQKFQVWQDRQRDLENRLRALQEEIPQLDTTMQKLGLEVDSAAKNLADAQRRIKELDREHQPSQSDDSRMAALEKEMARLHRDLQRLHDETAGVEEEIKALQDKIMEAGGEKLRIQRANVDALKEEVVSQNEETSNAEVRKAKAEKQRVKLARDHAKATKELEAAIHELEALDHDIDNQGEKAETLRSRVEEAEEALAAKEEELAALKAELDDKTAELNETRAVEIEMRNKLEENQKQLFENQKRLRYWDDKLAKLTIQDTDDLIGISNSSAAPATARGEEEGEEEEKAEDEEDDAGSGSEGDSQDETLRPKQDPDPTAHVRQPQQLPSYTPDELAGMSKDKLKGEIAALEEKTANVSVDLGVLAEYRRRVEEHAARSSDLASAIAQRDAAKKRCDELRRLRLEGFMEGFSIISLRLKEMYQMITMGGNAELELVDSLDPFSEGILFSVMPPKKSWKNIGNLSGGEKTLSSLALVFALHHYKPTPLYVMDEIDAALDFRNVSIVANYIKERTKNAQFIVISLRNNMFELAARLVGVYKVNHMTKSVTIENQDYIVGRRPQSQSQSQAQHPSAGLTQIPLR